MKTISRTLFLAAVAALAFGCARVNEQEPRVLETRTFSAVLDEDLTKTAYTADKKVVWQSTDVVRYYSYDGIAAVEAQLSSVSEDGAYASFRAPVESSDKYLIATYGGTAISENKGSGFTMAGVVKPEQDGTFASAHASAAKTTDLSGSTALHFKNLTSLIKFSVTREDIAYVVFNAADGENIHGNGSINVAFDTEGIPTASFGSTGGSSIKVAAAGAGTFYISMLPCTLAKGFAIKCYNAGGKSLGVVKTEKSVTLARNDMLNLGTIDSRITPDADDYYDLSETETANCYVVSSQGHYQFNATVKGNSSESVGAAAKAKVLWESFGTSTKPEAGSVVKEVAYNGGYIMFTAVNDGNAVVAVTDESDNILWSWHIWVCKDFDPAATAQKYANNAGTMMDRNLGALSATAGSGLALGLQYQWGRKDPFPGGADVADSTPAATSEAFPTPVMSTESTGTIAYAVANPMTFIQQNPTANPSEDWLITSTQLSADDSRWTSKKSMYDPCPAGWRVPDGGVDGIWSRAGFASGSFDSANKGILFSTSTPAAWYPATGGYTGDGTLTVVGMQGNWWSCTPASYVSYTLFISQSGADVNTHKVRAMGRSVRCLKTSDAPTVVAVESVSLNPTSLNISVGKTATLTATVVPDNATNKTVSWSSSNYEVATVSATGIVTAVAAGTAVITATSNNGKSASCTVTVGAKPSGDGTDLSATSTANCYIVSKAGGYRFDASVRGKSNVPLNSAIDSVAVIWESFGTDVAPNVKDIISDVTLDGSYIFFKASGKNGNAVIAAINKASKLIVWSWHIWVCAGFDPAATAQTYANNAAVMMDRNLGALSATRGDVTSLGLLYQWGRKDPFLSAGTLADDAVMAASTYSWPNSIESTQSAGTIANSIIYPTTFITENAYNRDWLNLGSSSTVDDARWNTDIAQYDPCPEGWTVPNGEIWKKAGVPSKMTEYDATAKGTVLAAQYCGTDSWYPFFGWIDNKTGSLSVTGTCGYYSRSVNGIYPLALTAVVNYNYLYTQGQPFRSRGYSVRCCKEVPVTGITISETKLQLGGDTLEGKLTATVQPENAVSKNYTWSSSNPDVVSVDASGKYVAKAAGSAVITVTTEEGGFKATCDVTVTEITTTSILRKLFRK